MKPTKADLRFWELAQSRYLPWWAYALERPDRVKNLARPSREKALAEALHVAINVRSGSERRNLPLANTLALLPLVRANNSRGLNAETGNTLVGYMHHRAYVAPDEQRAKYYRRWLRHLERVL